MNINITLKHGPLDIEIQADSEEEYKEEIIALLDLVEEHAGLMEGPPSRSMSSSGVDKPDGRKPDVEKVDSLIGPLASDRNIESNKLESLIHIDEDDDTLPFLLLDDVDLLGDTLPDRQRTASLIILYTAYICEESDEVHGPKLKDALDASDLSTNNMYLMREGEGKSYFDHNGGKGNASRIGLRGPGRRQAREEIERLIAETEK